MRYGGVIKSRKTVLAQSLSHRDVREAEDKMDFLQLLQGIRTPFLDAVLGVVTRLGEETVFLVAVMTVLWCVDKRWGYRLMCLGLAGNAVNQLLKGIFLIPRPWIQDPSFEIVESAKAAATGYSFPSGHTQGAATLFGGAAIWLRRKWSTLAAAAVILAVGFSRLYLGVHTPLDVGVGLAAGVLLVFIFDRVLALPNYSKKHIYALGAAAVALSAALLIYLLVAPKRPANVAEFDAHGLKAAFTLIGTTVGMCVVWFIDDRFIRFETSAVWWAQLIKLIGGFALVIGVRVLLKQPLYALTGGSYAADGIRYFLMTVVGGIVWPLTFRFWARLGRAKTAEVQ